MAMASAYICEQCQDVTKNATFLPPCEYDRKCHFWGESVSLGILVKNFLYESMIHRYGMVKYKNA